MENGKEKIHFNLYLPKQNSTTVSQVKWFFFNKEGMVKEKELLSI